MSDLQLSAASVMQTTDPIDAIERMLSERGWTRRHLLPAVGHTGRVSEIMNRKRPLTIHMIRCLVFNYKMDAKQMIQWYPTERNPEPEFDVVGQILETRRTASA